MHKFVIHVVESSSPAEILNGQSEGKALGETLSVMRVGHEHYVAVDKARFADALDRIVTTHAPGRAHQTHFPILHISCHGSEDGISLTSGAKITWVELGDMLRPLNDLVRGQLTVCMSACKGYHGFQMASTYASPPFGTIVGPAIDVSWQATLVAFVLFYHRFTNRIPRHAADYDHLMNAISDAVQLPRGTFRYRSGPLARQEAVDQVLNSLNMLLPPELPEQPS